MRVVSVVIPLLNEENLIDELLRRLHAVEKTLGDTAFEVIAVDDGSTDATNELLLKHLPGFFRWKLVSLSRNFGLQPAYKAGLDHASGEAVIFMDGDLQDPPEVIPELLAKWKSGSRVVAACRNSRQETGIRRGCFDLFHWLFHRMTEGFVPRGSGMFGLMDREVADHVRGLEEASLFFPALRCWPGYEQGCIYYDRDERFAGETKQSFSRLARYAWDGITSFSDMPLQMITLMGLVISGLAFALGMLLVLFRILQIFGLFPGLVVLGFTSIVLAVLFMGGLQMIALGVMGKYMARLYQEAKRRPHYVVANVQASPEEK